MYFSIDALTANGTRSIDVFSNDVDYLEAFTVWEDIISEAHNGFEIDLGAAGYLGLMTGDRVRLIQWDNAGTGTVVGIETVSADANKRRTF